MSTIVAARRPTDVVRRQGTEGPAPGLIDTLGASFRVAEDDQWIEQEQRLGERYNDLLSTLGDLGVDISREGGLYHYEQSPLPGKLAPQRVPDRDAIMAEVQRQRERWPDRFGTIGKSREDFERQVATRFGGRLRDQQVVRRGNGAVGLLGGLASGMTDPVNIATLPLGAGQASLLRTALVEAAIGAGTEVVNLPGTAAARERMGEDFTATDAVKQVAISGGASAILGGGLRGFEIAAPKVGGSVSAGIDATRLKLETAIADNWDRLPEAVRTRWVKGAPIGDADLPDLAEAIIGRPNMSVDEKGAIDALRRDAEIAVSSPFKVGAAGDAAHRERLDAATTALLRPVALGPRGTGLPVRPDRPSPSRGALSSSTALSSGASGPREALKARIRHVESGGNDVAKNPLSSAYGRFQFTRGTWVAYYKRRFGAQGLTDDQIVAKRGDARLQETLMDDLTADNARFLRTVGEAETAGNLYLTHFAGQGGARKLFAADPEASARSVLGGEVVDANPFLARMTAGDVIAWAHRKMQEPAPRRAGARSELADGEGAWRDRLQSEIDRIDAETDAARAARAVDDPLAAAIEGDGRALPSTDNELVPVDVVVDAPVDVPLPVVRARDVAAEGLPDREAALLPALRAEIAGTARLSDIDGLARRLEASDAEVRRALERIAATEKELLVRAKDGSFRRVPTDRAAPDAFKFLARKGGLADDEGHDLAEIFGVDAATTRKDGLTGKTLAASRRQPKYVPGVGPLVRGGGMSIDDAGEALFEAGYLRGGANDLGGGRPTTAEVLAYLEGGMAGKDALRTMVPMDRLSELDTFATPETLADMRAHMHEWANYQDAALDADDVEALARLMLRGDIENEDAALAALVNEAVVDALDDMRYESGDYDDAFARYLDTVEPDSRGERFQADAGNAGQSGARGASGDAGDGAFDDVGFADWNSGTDRIAAEQANSIIHDLDADADLFGGATRAERREALERRGEGGLSTDVEQKPVGSDGGLFDTSARGQAELPTFYLDEDGAARSWGDIADELDADDAELEAVRACL